MWYGSNYSISKRYEQSRECYKIINVLDLHKDTKFEYLRKLGIHPLQCARILHLLRNPDFGTIYED